MKLIQANRFKRDYKKLPPHIRKQTDKKLQYLVNDITHPSLRIKRVRKYIDVFEGSITKQKITGFFSRLQEKVIPYFVSARTIS